MPEVMSLAQAMLDVGHALPLSDVKVSQRLNRAYDIVRCNGSGYVINPQGEGRYLIHKASTSLTTDNSITYHVSRATCDCIDYGTARANLCKHRLAILLYEKVNGLC